MTLILKIDLDIVKKYHHTKNEVSKSTGSKVIAQTDAGSFIWDSWGMYEGVLHSKSY